MTKLFLFISSLSLRITLRAISTDFKVNFLIIVKALPNSQRARLGEASLHFKTSASRCAL